MSDNVNVTPGTGAIIATRDAGGGVEVQRVIPNTWNGSSAVDISAANPLPIVTYLYNGSANVLAETASASNLAAQSGGGVLLSTIPGQWSVVHTPVTATQATATKAAGSAGVRHIATSLTATYAAGSSAVAAAAPLLVNLRDGGTGAGTILWSSYINIPATAGQAVTIAINRLSLIGTAATAMTLEFSAAGGTNSYQSITLTGYDAS